MIELISMNTLADEKNFTFKVRMLWAIALASTEKSVKLVCVHELPEEPMRQLDHIPVVLDEPEEIFRAHRVFFYVFYCFRRCIRKDCSAGVKLREFVSLALRLQYHPD